MSDSNMALPQAARAGRAAPQAPTGLGHSATIANASEIAAERAIAILKRAIDAAENSNQAGENFVVAAATGPVLLRAVMSCVSAMRAYIVPDGIDGDEAMALIIAALDNPEITPIILEADHG